MVSFPYTFLNTRGALPKGRSREGYIQAHSGPKIYYFIH